MPRTNLQMENAWINAWNDLALLSNHRWDVVYITPDFAELSEEDAKGWLQSSAYQGFNVTVAEVWYRGRKAIQLQRQRPDNEET